MPTLSRLLPLCALLALPVHAQSVPERFALLDPSHMAALCSHALQDEAAGIAAGAATDARTVILLRTQIESAYTWAVSATAVPQPQVNRLQGEFDKQTAGHKEQQRSYCFRAGLIALGALPGPEAARIQEAARTVTQQLVAAGKPRY